MWEEERIQAKPFKHVSRVQFPISLVVLVPEFQDDDDVSFVQVHTHKHTSQSSGEFVLPIILTFITPKWQNRVAGFLCFVFRLLLYLDGWNTLGNGQAPYFFKRISIFFLRCLFIQQERKIWRRKCCFLFIKDSFLFFVLWFLCEKDAVNFGPHSLGDKSNRRRWILWENPLGFNPGMFVQRFRELWVEYTFNISRRRFLPFHSCVPLIQTSERK